MSDTAGLVVMLSWHVRLCWWTPSARFFFFLTTAVEILQFSKEDSVDCEDDADDTTIEETYHEITSE
jgi:hypothetical protein